MSDLVPSERALNHEPEAALHERGASAVTRPALRYHGGKWKLAPWLQQFFPAHRVYTEAFGGGALEFETPATEVRRGNGRFCSRLCQRSFQARLNASAMKGDLSQAEMNRRSRSATPPEVIRAHHAVEHEIEMGRMFRGVCEICQAERVDAHHDDYSRPLSVRWLCRGHHLEHHRRT